MSEWKGVVWLDRDGTIVDDPGYLSDPSKLRLLPGAAEAVRALNELDLAVVLVTNQSGIGRGRMTRATVDAVHAELEAQLARAGAHLEGIHLCPHRPADQVGPGRVPCDCRKPAPGLVLHARAELGIDRAFPQVCVGDREADLALGRATGCHTVLVETGEGRKTRERLQSEGRLEELADHVAADLASALPFLERRLLGDAAS